MARPQCCRRVRFAPSIYYFKPRGIPLSRLEEITLTMDELEAVRLADHEGRYQEQAAKMMSVSRQTFGRIIDSAHRKIAHALVSGNAIKIEGGNIQLMSMNRLTCLDCGHTWELSQGGHRRTCCPECGHSNFRRIKDINKRKCRRSRKRHHGGHV